MISAFGTVIEGYIKGTGELGSKRIRDNPNYYIIENDQNAEKMSGDLRRHAVTQIQEEDHQLTLVGKNLQEYNTDNVNNDNNKWKSIS